LSLIAKLAGWGRNISEMGSKKSPASGGSRGGYFLMIQFDTISFHMWKDKTIGSFPLLLPQNPEHKKPE